MTDIRVRSNFPGHRKTLRLARACGADAPLKLISLWCYAAEYRKDGWLSDLSIEDLELEARWSASPNQFVKALLQIGWLDLYPGRQDFEVHPEFVSETRIKVSEEAFEGGEWLNLVKCGVFYLHDWHTHNPYLASHQKRSEVAKKNIEKRWSKDAGGAGGETGKAGDKDTGMAGQLPLVDTGAAGAGGNGNHTDGGLKTESKPKTDTNGIPKVSINDTNRTKNDTPIPIPSPIPIPNPNTTSDSNNKVLQEIKTYSPADAGLYRGGGYRYGQGKGEHELPRSPESDAILLHFNEATGKNFELTGQKSLRAIRYWLDRGESVTNMQLVAAHMAKRWQNGDNRDYLRPQTVYGENYESYREGALSAAKEQINEYASICRQKPLSLSSFQLKQEEIEKDDCKKAVKDYLAEVQEAEDSRDLYELKSLAEINIIEYIKKNLCQPS